MENIIRDCDFSMEEKNRPLYWENSQPAEPLKPVFKRGSGYIGIEGGGKDYCFGYWFQEIDIKESTSYEYKVKMSLENIEDLHLNILNMICWIKHQKTGPDCAYDHISNYYKDGRFVYGKGTFKSPKGVTKAQIQLGFRYNGNGAVKWHEVALKETGDIAKRFVTAGSVKFNPYESGSKENNLKRIEGFLKKAGCLDCDIVLFPEYSSWYNYGPGHYSSYEVAENVPGGDTCRLFSEYAKKNSMYVCGGVLESVGEIVYNSTVIFDRGGNFIGKYRKTQLYWPESMFSGITPGNEFPVFDLDFGKAGVTTCYENWYGDVGRLLALKGAELLLFPNEGYEKAVVPGRAIEKMIHIVVSSNRGPSMIVSPEGKIINEIDTEGIIASQIEISNRVPPHLNSGGSLNASAGGRRCVKNSVSNKLYEETLKEIKSWEERPEDFYWS